MRVTRVAHRDGQRVARAYLWAVPKIDLLFRHIAARRTAFSVGLGHGHGSMNTAIDPSTSSKARQVGSLAAGRRDDDDDDDLVGVVKGTAVPANENVYNNAWWTAEPVRKGRRGSERDPERPSVKGTQNSRDGRVGHKKSADNGEGGRGQDNAAGEGGGGGGGGFIILQCLTRTLVLAELTARQVGSLAAGRRDDDDDDDLVGVVKGTAVPANENVYDNAWWTAEPVRKGRRGSERDPERPNQSEALRVADSREGEGSGRGPTRS
ncbi:hypothetical protein C8F01DRAFT_1230268 [Mycena amicta]|nr:hypothetical protein C8F01DRAFT_1230268 [Mycena amicta]